MRDAAKQIVLSLGAVGVAVFGAAPALKGLSFSWADPDDRQQLVVAIAFAVLGPTGIIGLIMVVGRTLMPVVVTLSDLSPEAEKELEKHEKDLLPHGVCSVDAFREKVRGSPEAVIFAKRQLASTPVHKKDEAQKVVDDVLAVRASLAKWTDTILRRDAFNRIRSSFLRPWGRAWILWALIAAAVIGSVGFISAISKPSPSAADAKRASHPRAPANKSPTLRPGPTPMRGRP